MFSAPKCLKDLTDITWLANDMTVTENQRVLKVAGSNEVSRHSLGSESKAIFIN